MTESPTPWSKEECRDRYVRGTAISLRQLAPIAGIPLNTLTCWCRKDGWVGQRKQVQDKLTAETDHKTIEKTSDRNSDLAVEHLNSYQSARRVIDAYFRWQSQKIEEVKDIPERLEAELKSIRPSNINFWLLALERAINGERLAAGLEWENVPKAIAFLERLGYVVADPTISINQSVQAKELGLSDEAAGLIKAKLLGLSEDFKTLPGIPDASLVPIAAAQDKIETH